MTTPRDASLWRGPIGAWLALGIVAMLAAAETTLHHRFDGSPVPWWHLGVAAGFVLWGRWRFLLHVTAGTALGLGIALAATNVPRSGGDTSIVDGGHLLTIGLVPLAESLGLAGMLLVLGRHRDAIVSGRVDLTDAMRLVGTAMPVALLPTLGLMAGVAIAIELPAEDVALRLVAGGFTGLVTAAPLTIALLPSDRAPQTYRCHCRLPAVPMVAMALLVPIGLLPGLPVSDPIQSMTVTSLAAMGVLGWLSLASGWMATSMGMLMLAASIWGSGFIHESPERLQPAVELLLLSPAYVIGLLFASTMESRFRDRARLADRHDELRTILDATGAAMLRTNEDGVVVFANAAARELASDGDHRLGGTLDDWLGKRASMRVLSALDASRRELEIVIREASADRRYEVVATPLHDDRGRRRGHTIVIVDLGPRLRREARRRRKQQRDTRTIATACLHEVNSIAMAVGGAASLARESSDDTTIGRLADEIERSCDDAARRAERLRHLARTRTSTATASIELGEIARARLDHAMEQGRIDRGDVRIAPGVDVRLSKGFGAFVIDEFIQNAVDAAPSGCPTISIVVRVGNDVENGAQAILELAEDGPGIAPAVRDRLGRGFVTSKGQGRGLGIAAIRTGIRHAGGDMRISSSDGGTTLRIELPLATRLGTVTDAI